MQARPAACDSDLVASVTNGALQLAWCDAAGGAIWIGGRGFGVFVGRCDSGESPSRGVGRRSAHEVEAGHGTRIHGGP
jgi:hypothetical protein